MNPEQEAVYPLYDAEKNLVGIVKRDLKNTKKNLVYRCKEMDTEDIARMIGHGV